MDAIIGNNIRHLRKLKGLTQDQLGEKTGINRAAIASYEENRAQPKLSTLRAIARLFDLSIDDLVSRNLLEEAPTGKGKIDTSGQTLRVLSTVVDRSGKELISLVPLKASAGYQVGYSDPGFIETLPTMAMPVPELSQERTYRAFQIKGDSMEPVPTGSWIFCEYVQDWEDIRDGETAVVVTLDEGIVFKRLYRDGEMGFWAKSDNPVYEPYPLAFENIQEIWRTRGYLSFSLPTPPEISLHKLTAMVHELKEEVERLKGG